jgi:hypothetical protein
MDVVVQWVRTSWTKASRGGAAAARRNAAPVAFPLPGVAAPLMHEVLMSEGEDFQPRSSQTGAVPDEIVSLRLVDGLLRVRLEPTPFGMPRRWRRPPALRLAPGEWLRWQINYRFSYPAARGGAWTYRLDTLNLAHAAQVPAGIFLGEPTHWIDELAHLR